MGIEQDKNEQVPQPIQNENTDALPSALTFFITRSERRELIRALNKLSPRRGDALKIALGIK